jgi:hypothetical protein
MSYLGNVSQNYATHLGVNILNFCDKRDIYSGASILLEKQAKARDFF